MPLQSAIVGIDLADKKQMVVVCDHDSRVLARRTFRCRAWDLGAALLRQLHAIIVTGNAWDADIAVYGTRHRR